MQRPFLFTAAVAGVMASFAIPVPRQPGERGPAARQAGATQLARQRSSAAAADHDWPTDAAFIAKLPANESGAALDRILRHSTGRLPDGETADAAIALSVRLADLASETSATRNPFRNRPLPSWVLRGVTKVYLERSSSLPAVWMAAVAQSASGLETMSDLTGTLAETAPGKAHALAEACPPDWKGKLEDKLLDGLAVRDPVAAAREAWQSGALFGRTLDISARSGPVKETVNALMLYGAGEPRLKEQVEVLATLLQRDPAGTRAAVEQTGDPALAASLKSAEALPAPKSEAALLTEAELAAAAKDHSRDLTAYNRQFHSFGALHPDEVPALLQQLKKDSVDPFQASGLVTGMASVDPASAWQCAKSNAPGLIPMVFGEWVKSDGPSAIQAALTLESYDPVREAVELVMKNPAKFEAPFAGTRQDRAVAWRRQAGGWPVSEPARHYLLAFGDEIRSAALHAIPQQGKRR